MRNSFSDPPYQAKRGIKKGQRSVALTVLARLDKAADVAFAKEQSASVHELPREEVFSETVSEFLCEGVSRCLLLGYWTGAKRPISPIPTHKVARS